MNSVALAVRQYLNFHVTRVGQELLQVHHGVAEGGARFNLGQLDRLDQLGLFMHNAHAATTAAAGGLDDDRVANALGNLQAFGFVLGQRAVGAGHGGYAGVFNLLGKVGVLGQEAVAGVDAVGAGHFRRADDRRDVQVGQGRRSRADADGFVSHGQVHEFTVGGGVHRHGFQTEFLARADNPQGNFTSVGNKYFLHRSLQVGLRRC